MEEETFLLRVDGRPGYTLYLAKDGTLILYQRIFRYRKGETMRALDRCILTPGAYASLPESTKEAIKGAIITVQNRAQGEKCEQQPTPHE